MRLAWPLLGLLFAVSCAEAKFADTQGFSGKHGLDCGACHAPAPVAPWPPSEVFLEGLPSAWDASQEYPLRVRVEGGPVAAPGMPQAGFDLETDGGTLRPTPGMEEFLRFPSDQEATYTGAGTRMRQWDLTWKAPPLDRPPAPVRFWLAGLAANGNHVADGMGTAGESGDAFALLRREVAPSHSTQRAWHQQPLPAPVLDPRPSEAPIRTPVLVTGRVANFTDGAQWRLDEREWTAAAGSPAFLFYVNVETPGDHTLEVRTVWGDRRSTPVSAPVTAVGDAVSAASEDGSLGPPAAAAWLAAGLVLAITVPFLIKVRK